MSTPEQLYAGAVDALNRSDWSAALQMSGRLLPQAESHAGVHFVAGVAAMHLQRMPLALQMLQRAVRLNPHRSDYRAQLARILAMGRRLREAVEMADAAIKLGADDALTLDTLGVVFTQANEHGKAVQAFGKAATLKPDHASFRFNHATALMFVGDIEQAELEYEACIALQPDYWKAYLALSQLRKQSSERNHVAALSSVLNRVAQQPIPEMYVHLALSKELEDLGNANESFEHLVAAKAAGGKARGYVPDRDREIMEALALASKSVGAAADGYPSSEPIFVIGMPRSGTTLVDRILSSHPDVHSAGELQNFPDLLKRASGSRTRLMLDIDTVGKVADIDWRRLGQAYIESTRPGTGRKPRFVDKLPHNFLYAGFIARALPNARIICLRRNPMDTCLSNFRQLFAQSSPFYDYSFDLLDTGRYYLQFERLMAHWHAVLPGRILEVSYEGLVADQETVTRSLLEHCGLDWNEACLRFERNQAPVATASVVQVRSALYSTAVNRWKRFETQLQPLRDLLVAGGIAVE